MSHIQRPWFEDFQLPTLPSPPGSVGRARFLPRPRPLIWPGVCEGVGLLFLTILL